MTETILTRDDAGHVRPMARHDVSVVAAMIGQLARHHGDEPDIDAAGLEADLFAGDPWLRGLVVERFDHVVGYALVGRHYHAQFTRRGAELNHLFVQPGSRGLGLGRMLVDAVIAMARAEQCHFVSVGTHPANARAQAFYISCGFDPRGAPGPRYAIGLD